MSRKRVAKRRQTRMGAGKANAKSDAAPRSPSPKKQAPAASAAKAMQLLRKRQFVQAKTILLHEVSLHPNPKALSALSLAHLGCGEIEAAAEAVARAISLGLDSAGDQLGFGGEMYREGDWSRAEASFELAAQIQPNCFEAHVNFATVAHRNEHLEAAVAGYDRAIELVPGHFPALYNRGVALKRLGRYEAATRSLELAMGVDPQNVDVLCNLGQVAQCDKRSAEAKHWFELALARRSDADVLHALANACLSLEQFDEAAKRYFQSLEMHPNNADALNNLGAALRKMGSEPESRRCFEQAIAIEPRHAGALENIGDLHARAGDFEAALDCFEKAAALDAAPVSVWLKTGRARRRLKQPAEARQAFEAALKLCPQSGDALSELGMIAFHEGDHPKSLELLSRAIDSDASNPLYSYLRASSLPVIYADDTAIDDARAHVADSIDHMLDRGLRMDPRRHTPNTFFYLAYHGRNDRELQSRIASLWAPCDARRNEHAAGASQTDRIRVGFLTRYLTDHTIGMLTGGLIAMLDKQRFETVTMTYDEKHPWFKANCDEFHVAPQRPGELIDFVAEQRLDVLVFPEIGMDAVTNTVARSRMAPVQCAMWGHPVTTGIPTIDYFLSSTLLEDEDAANHYSESLVLLDTLPAYYYRPKPHESLKSRADLGFRDSETIYACPQSLFKIHPEFDAVLDAVLEEDPQGVVVLIEGGDALWTRQLQTRLKRTVRNAARIKFLPRMSGEDFYALLACADVALDPLHFGGGRSNYLTMAAGTPLVTLASEFMRGRVALGMYRKLDYLECVAESKEAYIEKAVAMANDRDYRRQVGNELRERSESLFEDKAAVRALEQFLDDAHRRAT